MPVMPLLLGRDAEGFAIEIQIEPARRPLASADAVESQLLQQIAMRLDLEPVSEPVLARNADVEKAERK
jgi:hypothetical protein